MEILYNYQPYQIPKQGVFNVSFEYGHNENGVLDMIQKSETAQIIGETDDQYINELKPCSNIFGGVPDSLLPLGFHKTRLLRWLPVQTSLF